MISRFLVSHYHIHDVYIRIFCLIMFIVYTDDLLAKIMNFDGPQRVELIPQKLNLPLVVGGSSDCANIIVSCYNFLSH